MSNVGQILGEVVGDWLGPVEIAAGSISASIGGTGALTATLTAVADVSAVVAGAATAAGVLTTAEVEAPAAVPGGGGSNRKRRLPSAKPVPWKYWWQAPDEAEVLPEPDPLPALPAVPLAVEPERAAVTLEAEANAFVHAVLADAYGQVASGKARRALEDEEEEVQLLMEMLLDE